MRAAARPDLAAVWRRTRALAQECGRDPAEVPAVERPSHISGVEPERVPQVAAGTAVEAPPERRVHQRFLRLRATRRDKHGREWPPAAIVGDFGAPGASPGPLNAGTGLPRMGHAAGAQRSSGSTPVSSVRDREDPLPAVLRAHGVRGTVTRAGRLSPRGWKSPADHLDDLLAREGQLGIPGTKGGAPIEGTPAEGVAP